MSTEVAVIRQALEKMTPQFKMALPAHVSTERFVRILMTAVSEKPQLLECDRASLYGAAMRAAQDGLLPDGREGAIVPAKGKATWRPMVAGVMKKVRNSGEVSSWSVQVVKENDAFDYELGDNEHIMHKPARTDRGATVGAYSIVNLKDGEKSREYMGIDEINGIRDRSDGYKYAVAKGSKDTPWLTDPDEMAKKTVVRRHSKRLPMSTDLDGMLRDPDDEPLLPLADDPAPPAPTEKPGLKERMAASGQAAPPAQALEQNSEGQMVIKDAEIVQEPVKQPPQQPAPKPTAPPKGHPADDEVPI